MGAMSLHDPAVTLTDYLLAVECAWFAATLARRSVPPAAFLRRAFVLLFATTAAASVLGGTTHGFFPDPASAGNRVLWLATLLTIGAVAMAMLAVAASIGIGTKTARRAIPGLWLLFGAYAAVVVFGTRNFLVAIAVYLPAALLLLAAFARGWRSRRNPGAAAGIGGVVVTLLAAAGQQAGLGLHPVYFNHNAVYHVVQAIALYLLFRAARVAVVAE
jgi:hypothetical protein